MSRLTTVRTLNGDDWPMWREIRLRALQDSPSAFGSTYAREVEFGERLWRERLDDPDAVSVLATDDHAPVGMGAGFPDRPGLLHVVAMWVAPGARGRGIAHDVLGVVEEWASQRGLALYLDVVAGNAAGRRCYVRYGFVATGETEPVRPGSDEVQERMVLDRMVLDRTVSGTQGSR